MVSHLLIISPAFNEEVTVARYVEAMKEKRVQLAAQNIELRVLVINDGSTDSTDQKLSEASQNNPGFFSHLSLAGNFGYQAALLAGLRNIGEWPDIVVTMDLDLEHPVEVIDTMIAQWRQGNLLVNTVRLPHKGVPYFKRVLSDGFYRVARVLTGLDIVPGQADFRLWDADLIRDVDKYLENIGSLRLFAIWLPVRKSTVVFEQNVVPGRVTRFTLKKNWELAISGLVRYSPLPLRMIKWLGGMGLVFSVGNGVHSYLASLTGQVIPGWTSLILTVLFVGSVNTICIGVLASYLNRLTFATDLPRFISKRTHGKTK